MSTSGKKPKLPDGWIVVNSKSHPDRVYYFNVKTNKSSWDEPTLIDAETTTPAKDGRKSKKRKQEENGSAQARPTTPEIHQNDNASLFKRQILRAKRSSGKKNQSATPKETPQNETPQMRLIREKMLQKKSKSMTGKRSTSKSVESTTDTTDSTGTTSTTDCTGTTGTTESTSTTTECAVTSTSDDKVKTKNGALTPQMRAILEKMKEKPNKPKVTKKLRSPVTINKSSTITKKATESTKNAVINSVTAVSTGGTKSIGRRRAKTEAVNLPQKRKSLQKVKGRKNIAQERMENLRRSLEAEVQNDKAVKSPNKPSATIVNQLPEPPISTYKDANVRLRQLRVKLLREQLFSENHRNVTNEENKNDESLSSNDFPTVNKLIQQSVRESFYEDMEWESIPDEEIMCEVNNVRTQLYMNNNPSSITSVPENTLNITVPSEERDNNPLYIVVDTNVFLSNLQAVEEARDAVFRTHSRPIIVIPWTVIRELDYLKEDRANAKSETLSAKARRAIRFLHQHFSSKHPRVLGQTPKDVERNKERFAIDCPDDEILQTCLQIQESGKSVVLLSYDKNLGNKAMIHDISTLGRNEPLEKIDYLNASFNKNDCTTNSKIDVDKSNIAMPPTSQELRITDEIFEDAKSVMKSFLTVVVAHEMENLFGENWEKYTIIRPPWTMEQVLKCALKHWMAAVSESFLRRGEYILKDLLPAFTILPDGGRRIHDVAHLLDRCSDLIQTTKIDKHPDLMIKASNSIDELKQKLSDYEAALKRRSLQDDIRTNRSIEEAEVKAKRAFDYFEEVYKYSRDICGLAAEKVRMPCSFFYAVPDPIPNDDTLKQIQPDLAANINRLIHVLRNALEQVDDSCMDNRCLNSLFWTITNFLPDDKMRLLVKKHGEFLEPADVYCCLKEKQQLLQTGLRQLQELCTHFCRLATYKIGS